MKKQVIAFVAFLVFMGLTMQLTLWKDEKYVECLDKICDDDVTPPADNLREQALKLHGQWFFAPKAYARAGNSLVFYWPSKEPFSGREDGKAYPEKSNEFFKAAIQIFMAGRQQWPVPSLENQWMSSPWDNQKNRLQKEGLQMERQTVKPGLDLVKFKMTDGQPYPEFYYLATERQRIRGNGPPLLKCNEDLCTAGEYWQEDVYTHFLFSSAHARDWPAVHEEIVRVMNLIRKVPCSEQHVRWWSRLRNDHQQCRD